MAFYESHMISPSFPRDKISILIVPENIPMRSPIFADVISVAKVRLGKVTDRSSWVSV